MAASWQALNTNEYPLNISFGETNYSFSIKYLQSFMVEEAARSGLFDELETRMLLKLSRFIYFHNINIRAVSNTIPHLKKNKLTEQIIDMHFKAHHETRSDLIAIIQKVNELLRLDYLDNKIKHIPPQQFN